MVADQAEPVLEALGEALVQHRAVQDVLRRVADRRAAQPLVELADVLVVDRLVDDRGAERRAALAGRAVAAEQRALDREVDVGVVHHDHRVLAAELEARRLQVAAAQLADLRADRARAGEADLVDEPLLERALETLERLRALGLHDVEHAAGHAAGVEELGQRVAERRRVLGRLPDDRVAAQDRRHEVPGGNGDGEVAGGDDRGDADRHAEREELLARHLRRHGLAVQPPTLADEEVAGVDDLLHLAERLGVRLADLAGDEPRQRLLVGLDEPADVGDHAPARGRRQLRPVALRGAGGAAGVDERGGVAQPHLGDGLGGVGGVRRGQAAARSVGERLPVDDRADLGRGERGHTSTVLRPASHVSTTRAPARSSNGSRSRITRSASMPGRRRPRRSCRPRARRA